MSKVRTRNLINCAFLLNSYKYGETPAKGLRKCWWYFVTFLIQSENMANITWVGWPRPHVSDIFESATFSFRVRLSSTRIRRIRKQIRKFLNPLSKVEIFQSDNILADSKISGYVWTGFKYFLSAKVYCRRVTRELLRWNWKTDAKVKIAIHKEWCETFYSKLYKCCILFTFIH